MVDPNGGKPRNGRIHDLRVLGRHARLADTHNSFPLAPHELGTNNYVIDGIVGAAIRPPQVELWGARVLDWILRKPRKVDYVVHLGDAANIACTSEFERFVQSMKHSTTSGCSCPEITTRC